MNCKQIDQYAAQMPFMAGLLPCLYVPIAAKSINAIETYVGLIKKILSPRSKSKALFIEAYEPEKMENRLPIWKLPSSSILHDPQQIWVHVDYTGYRNAYTKAFESIDFTNFVIDHVMNRRVARLKGFKYLRIVPVNRAVNSSHGGLSEKWAVAYHSSPKMLKKNKESKATVQYADLSDIVKMMNIGGGGSLMDNVNEAQKLVKLPDTE